MRESDAGRLRDMNDNTEAVVLCTILWMMVWRGASRPRALTIDPNVVRPKEESW